MQIKADVFQHVAIYQYVEHYFYDFLFTFFSSLTVSPKQIQSGPVYFIKAVSIKLTNNK